MMMEWTVRVVNFKHRSEAQGYSHSYDRLPTKWIEMLKHMGLVKVLLDESDREVLEFRCPHEVSAGLRSATRIWADENAARMLAMGINASPAPKWEDV